MERNLHNSCVADLDEMVKDDYVIGFKLLNSDYSKLRILKNDVSDYDSEKVYESSEEENSLKAVINNEIFEVFNLESDKDEASTNTHFDSKQVITDCQAPNKNKNYNQKNSSFALISSVSQNTSDLGISKSQIKNGKIDKANFIIPSKQTNQNKYGIRQFSHLSELRSKIELNSIEKAEFKKRLNHNSSCKALTSWTKTRSAKYVAKYLYCLKQENTTQQDRHRFTNH